MKRKCESESHFDCVTADDLMRRVLLFVQAARPITEAPRWAGTRTASPGDRAAASAPAAPMRPAARLAPGKNNTMQKENESQKSLEFGQAQSTSVQQ